MDFFFTFNFCILSLNEYINCKTTDCSFSINLRCSAGVKLGNCDASTFLILSKAEKKASSQNATSCCGVQGTAGWIEANEGGGETPAPLRLLAQESCYGRWRNYGRWKNYLAS